LKGLLSLEEALSALEEILPRTEHSELRALFSLWVIQDSWVWEEGE